MPKKINAIFSSICVINANKAGRNLFAAADKKATYSGLWKSVES